MPGHKQRSDTAAALRHSRRRGTQAGEGVRIIRRRFQASLQLALGFCIIATLCSNGSQALVACQISWELAENGAVFGGSCVKMPCSLANACEIVPEGHLAALWQKCIPSRALYCLCTAQHPAMYTPSNLPLHMR